MTILGWRSIIISQHAKLSYTSHLMVVQTKDGINQVPIEDIQLVLISTTQAVITTALISELSKQNVKVVFVGKTMRPCCETVNYYPNNRTIDLLMQQINWDHDRREILWTKIIHEKIKNQIQVLNIYGHRTDELKNELEKLEINDLSNREAVVARKYFPLLFKNEKFSRRTGTAVNNALNYGYSILLSMFSREIVERGYLTYLGIHHKSNENQFNLASDLMEPFRPVIDYWVANQNFTELTPDVKYGLIDALNIEITYSNQKMLLRNAIGKYAGECFRYLDNELTDFNFEMEFNHEVPNNALVNHV